MPRGENQNSKDNLRVLSSKEARENGRKGGLKSAEVRAERKSWRQTMEEKATPEVKADVIDALLSKARSGNLDAIKLYLEWTEQKPSTKMDINANIPVVIVDDIPEPEESV